MTDKELRRLSRAELADLLLAQMEENRKLKLHLEQLQAQLDSRQIKISRAGSLTEAARQISGIFEAAQEDAAQYLDNIERCSEEGESVRRQIEAEARKKAELVCAEADSYSERTRAQADQYQAQVTEKVQKLLKEQESLRSLLAAFGGDAARRANSAASVPTTAR